MRTFLTLSATLLITGFLHAQQCSVSIPSSAIIIENDTSVGSYLQYWVCSGVTVEFTGAFAYVEEGCTVTINGNLGNYSIKANSTISVSGFNNVVVHDDTDNVVDNGNNTFLTSCPMVQFDYTNAPAPGCTPTNISESTTPSIHLFPNPTTNNVFIDVPNQKIGSVRLLDMHGRIVLVPEILNGYVKLGTLVPGTYLIELRTDIGVLHERIIIE